MEGNRDGTLSSPGTVAPRRCPRDSYGRALVLWFMGPSQPKAVRRGGASTREVSVFSLGLTEL